MKKNGLWGAAALVAGLGMTTGARADVVGEYVEARSLSVHAGACHFNGEVSTAGREAVLVWKVDSGVLDGVRVDGLGVVAVIAGGENLAGANVARRSVLYVDGAATPAQHAALVKMVTAKARPALGTLVAVKRAPFAFETKGKLTTVSAGNVAKLSVSRYPCDHCVMPSQTWYKPFVSGITDAKVAQGMATGFKDAMLGVAWSQEASDNVFIGTFAF